MVVLTLETVPTTGAFTHVNHLDLAVSQTGNPTGLWNIYRMDVTNDGSPATAVAHARASVTIRTSAPMPTAST